MSVCVCVRARACVCVRVWRGVRACVRKRVRGVAHVRAARECTRAARLGAHSFPFMHTFSRLPSFSQRLPEIARFRAL